MKAIWIALAPLAFAGCLVETMTTTAIQAELAAQNATAAANAYRNAGASLGASQISRALQSYRAEYAVFPPSLEALVPTHLQAVPTTASGNAYYYNPLSGEFSQTPIPGVSAVTAEDRRNLDVLGAAIGRYWQGASSVPPSLQALVESRRIRWTARCATMSSDRCT